MGFSALGLGCWVQKVSPPLLSGETGEMTGCFVSSSPQTPGHHLPKICFLPTPSPKQHPQLTNTRGTKEFPRQPISELP